MELEKIIGMVNSIPGGLSVAGVLLWLLPRVIKKEVAAKWVRAAIRGMFSRINMGGQGWRATVLFIAANAVDEADKIFDMTGRYNQDGADKNKIPDKITVATYNLDGSLRTEKTFVAHDKPEICAAAYRTDFYEAVAAGADDIQCGEASGMEVR